MEEKQIILCTAADTPATYDMSKQPFSWNTCPLYHCIIVSVVCVGKEWGPVSKDQIEPEYKEQNERADTGPDSCT